MHPATQAGRTAPAVSDHYVDDVEAARILGLSASYLRKLRVSGGGPRYSKLSARAVRYKLRDVLAWADSKAVASTSDLVAA
jgi:hypothetical protein